MNLDDLTVEKIADMRDRHAAISAAADALLGKKDLSRSEIARLLDKAKRWDQLAEPGPDGWIDARLDPAKPAKAVRCSATIPGAPHIRCTTRSVTGTHVGKFHTFSWPQDTDITVLAARVRAAFDAIDRGEQVWP